MLSYTISSGIMSMGINVLHAGVISTPCLIYYSNFKQTIGIMITASHNPYMDNGIKIINSGKKLTNAEELLLEKAIDNDNYLYDINIGTLTHINILDEYYSYIKNYMDKTNMKVCIDCANGATYKIAGKVFKDITNDLVIVANNPNGYNINQYCGSTNINNLKSYVLDNNCDIGFAFDGDGDRIICVDRFGNILDGDMIIYILAIYLKKHNMLKNDTVALTIMSNLGIIHALKDKGISVIEANVGDKNVIDVINKYDLSLGGENSGHIIIPNISNTGDGVLVALQIIKILEDENIDISNLLNDVYMYPNKMINIKVNNKNIILKSKFLLNKINEIKRSLNYDCKIIVRQSGTEDLIRITVMAKSSDLVEQYSNELEYIVKNLPNLT